MAQVIIDGKLYTIYEMVPRCEIPKDLKLESQTRKEKKDHFKKMAKFNYRKK